MLQYGNYSFSFNENNSMLTIQNVSVYHDRMCYTNREIIHVDTEEYQTVDNIEIIISNSQFNDVYRQPIIDIKDNSITIGCKIWIINCTFESIITDHTSIITATISQFNTALNFFNCEFHYCSVNTKYLVVIVVILETNNFRNVACTNITFNKCNFSNNVGGLLSLRNAFMLYCTLYILLKGPTNISDNVISGNIANTLKLIYIEGMAIDSTDIHIYGPINISNNVVHNDNLMVFQSCNVSINGPITISSNVALKRNVMLIDSCIVLFQGPITISQHFGADSIILFTACDITFDKQIMFI